MLRHGLPGKAGLADGVYPPQRRSEAAGTQDARLVPRRVPQPHRLRERVLDPGLRMSILEFTDLCYTHGTGTRDLPPEEAIALVRRRIDLVGSRYAVLSEQIGCDPTTDVRQSSAN